MENKIDYTIIYSKRFEKHFRKLPKNIQKQIINLIENLKHDPYIGKPLKFNLRGYWSLRIGNYRVIYKIDKQNKIITIYIVRHRRKVYK